MASPQRCISSTFTNDMVSMVIVLLGIPLIDLEKIWESPGAHLMVNFYSQLGSGFHLTPGGLEFDEHVMKIGKYTTMRVAASILFPRRLPPEEGEQPIRIEIHRLGVKTRMM
eukprot:Gb_41159 [translate_table: standard]